MTFDFSKYVDPGTVLLALTGAAGGLVRWATLRSHWTDGLIAIGVGAACSVFLSPSVAPVLGQSVHAIPFLGSVAIDADSMTRFSAFLSGVGGISVTGFMIDAMRLVGRLALRRVGGEPPHAPGPKP